ncbi:MAG: hypothetical protein ROO73_00435 [Roseivirga sp.]
MISTNEYRWHLIFFCVSGATVFWIFNALNKEYTAEIECPVQFVIDESKVEFVEPPPRTLPLEVKGGGWKLVRYLVYLEMYPAELPIAKVTRRGLIRKEQLRTTLDKKLKDLRVEKVLIDTLYIRTQPKTVPRE